MINLNNLLVLTYCKGCNIFISFKTTLPTCRLIIIIETGSQINVQKLATAIPDSWNLTYEAFVLTFFIDKGVAKGWTGVEMFTTLSSGQYLFLSKNDMKNIRYTYKVLLAINFISCRCI